MEYDQTRAVGLLVALIVVGVAGLVAGDVMPTDVILMMVLPSMVVFGGIAFFLGMKHGEHRAAR